MSSANDAFAIEMSGGSVHDGKGGTIFSNIGGSLTINQVQFSRVKVVVEFASPEMADPVNPVKETP